MMNISINL